MICMYVHEDARARFSLHSKLSAGDCGNFSPDSGKFRVLHTVCRERWPGNDVFTAYQTPRIPARHDLFKGNRRSQLSIQAKVTHHSPKGR